MLGALKHVRYSYRYGRNDDTIIVDYVQLEDLPKTNYIFDSAEIHAGVCVDKRGGTVRTTGWLLCKNDLARIACRASYKSQNGKIRGNGGQVHKVCQRWEITLGPENERENLKKRTIPDRIALSSSQDCRI